MVHHNDGELVRIFREDRNLLKAIWRFLPVQGKKEERKSGVIDVHGEWILDDFGDEWVKKTPLLCKFSLKNVGLKKWNIEIIKSPLSQNFSRNLVTQAGPQASIRSEPTKLDQ
jgi:hypothetical protein